MVCLLFMQNKLNHKVYENFLQQQLLKSFRMYRLFLTIQYNLGDAFLKSSKDFIN